MQTSLLAFVVAVASLLPGVAHAQAEAPAKKAPTYYAKSGVTPARYDADLAACLADAKKIYDAEVAKINAPYQPGLGGAAASGLFTGWQKGKLKREGIARAGQCLEKKGYRKVPYTAAQLETWNQLNHEQRLKAGGILASGGNIARLLSN
jgi:hypothetical protein